MMDGYEMKGANPLVSVIVPTFNSSKTIDICLDSVRRQTYPDIELIVIDKHSTDDTAARALEYGAELLLTTELRSNARNIAARESKGDFLVFLDSDITLTERVIEECVEKVKRRRPRNNIPEAIVGEGSGQGAAPLRHYATSGTTQSSPRFMSKRVFEEAGGFNAFYEGQEDWDLRERIFEKGYKACRIQALTMHHEGRVRLIRRLQKNTITLRPLKYMRDTRGRRSDRSLFEDGLLRNIGTLAKDPVHAVGFVLMKTLETVVSAAGIVNTRYKNQRMSMSRHKNEGSRYRRDRIFRKPYLRGAERRGP